MIERVPYGACPERPLTNAERAEAWRIKAKARRTPTSHSASLLDAARAGEYVDPDLLPDWHPDSLLYRGP